MDRPFLQTPEWLAFQKSLGRKVWRLDDGFIKANIIRYPVRFGQSYLSVPYGPELNLDLATQGMRNEVGHFTSFLRQLARSEGSMFVRLEPMHDVAIELLQRNGMKVKKSPYHVQPSRTVVLDLTQTNDDLLDHLHHKHRYNLGLARRKGVTIQESTDDSIFWKLLKKTAEHDDFRTHDQLYYAKLLHYFADPEGALRTKLYLAMVGGRPIGGVIMLECGYTVYYLHGAMDREYRSIMAPHLLHWTLIEQYKREGYKWYDFWGIDAGKWPGVTRFKLGFGAQVVEYPGAFDLVLKPFWRWLYNWWSK